MDESSSMADPNSIGDLMSRPGIRLIEEEDPYFAPELGSGLQAYDALCERVKEYSPRLGEFLEIAAQEVARYIPRDWSMHSGSRQRLRERRMCRALCKALEDVISPQPPRIFIATTNNPEQVDENLKQRIRGLILTDYSKA